MGHNINIVNTLKGKNLDAAIITNPINIFYLSGFRGVSPTEREAIMIVFKSKPSLLITAKLYQAEAQKLKSKNLKIQITAERAEVQKTIESALSNLKGIAFEGENLTFSEYKKYQKLLKRKLVPVRDLVENLRQIKNEDEIANIKKAQALTQSVFDEVLKTIKVGQPEAEIKDNLEKIAKIKSREPLAFDPIIASGPNSSLPHYVTGNRKIKKGDALLFDFGLKYKNYCADFSRTIFVGRATEEQKNIYTLVALAQKEALKKLKTNIKAKDVYLEAFNLFKKNSLEDKFIHSLGHGIGLEVHEKPSLYVKSKDILVPGMVFSVEPGLYMSWGGVRIEDLATIKNNQAEIFGKNAKFIELNH